MLSNVRYAFVPGAEHDCIVSRRSAVLGMSSWMCPTMFNGQIRLIRPSFYRTVFLRQADLEMVLPLGRCTSDFPYTWATHLSITSIENSYLGDLLNSLKDEIKSTEWPLANTSLIHSNSGLETNVVDLQFISQTILMLGPLVSPRVQRNHAYCLPEGFTNNSNNNNTLNDPWNALVPSRWL